MQRRKKRGCEGFTIVEVIIASAILVVISGSFILAYLSAMRTHMVAIDYYKATCIARNRIQRARTLEYDSLPLLREVASPVDEDGILDVGGQYRRTTVVSNLVPACSRISVSVRFPVPNGKLSPESVDVHTMITQGI